MKREVWQHKDGTIEDNQGNLYIKAPEPTKLIRLTQRCKGIVMNMFPNDLNKIKGKKK